MVEPKDSALSLPHKEPSFGPLRREDRAKSALSCGLWPAENDFIKSLDRDLSPFMLWCVIEPQQSGKRHGIFPHQPARNTRSTRRPFSMRLGLLAVLLLGACDALPRDPADTSTRIEQTRSFTVALADPSISAAPQVDKLVREIERRTKARAQWRTGFGEPLLQQLDNGSLDLVIGRFTADSPWSTNVAFGPALSTSGSKDAPVELKAAMRNGENRWIITVERASRAISREDRK